MLFVNAKYEKEFGRIIQKSLVIRSMDSLAF